MTVSIEISLKAAEAQARVPALTERMDNAGRSSRMLASCWRMTRG